MLVLVLVREGVCERFREEVVKGVREGEGEGRRNDPGVLAVAGRPGMYMCGCVCVCVCVCVCAQGVLACVFENVCT
jgi:hypothetical protein